MRVIENKICNSVKHEGKLSTEKYVVLHKTLFRSKMTTSNHVQNIYHREITLLLHVCTINISYYTSHIL